MLRASKQSQWVLYKIRKNKISNWTNFQMDKHSNRAKSRMNETQSGTKSRIGQNPQIERNPEWTKSRMDKIWYGKNPELDKIPNRTNFY